MVGFAFEGEVNETGDPTTMHRQRRVRRIVETVESLTPNFIFLSYVCCGSAKNSVCVVGYLVRPSLGDQTSIRRVTHTGLPTAHRTALEQADPRTINGQHGDYQEDLPTDRKVEERSNEVRRYTWGKEDSRARRLHEDIL